MSTTGNLKMFVDGIINNGGATYQYASAEKTFNPQDGFMVSLPQEYEKVIENSGDFEQIKAELITYLKQPNVIELFAKHPDTYLGGWSDSGKIYIDLSQKFDTEEEARKVGTDHNQLAIFDNANGQVIHLK